MSISSDTNMSVLAVRYLSSLLLTPLILCRGTGVVWQPVETPRRDVGTGRIIRCDGGRTTTRRRVQRGAETTAGAEAEAHTVFSDYRKAIGNLIIVV